MLRTWLLGSLAAAVGVITLAAICLPWWGVLSVVAALVLLVVYGLPFLISQGVRRYATGMFLAKGRVLHGAAVHIHTIAYTEPPSPDEGEVPAPDAGDDRLFVLLDATIAPADPAPDSPFSTYDPSDIQLVPFDADVTLEAIGDADEPETFCDAVRAEVIAEDGSPEEPGRIAGPARLRFVFSVPADMPRRVKLRYYFESFGDLALPEPRSAGRCRAA